MVGHATVEKESEAVEVDYRNIQSDDITKLSKVVGGRYLLSIDGLNQLSTVYNFSQVRISCSKPYHGRTFDIMTTTTSDGTWARDWLLHRRSDQPKPPSCGSYARLPEDTSYLGANCEKWRDGEWYYNHLYVAPIGAWDGARTTTTTTTTTTRDVFSRIDLWYHVSLEGGRNQLCDDYTDHPHFSSVGHWSYYMR